MTDTPIETPIETGKHGSDSAMPALTIVIPAYNVAPYIGVAVESALDQSLRDIEVVVVDDGSTDSTPQVLAGIVHKRRDGRLRIIRQTNGGLSAARNTGILNARARLIGFLDGDDAWLAQKAERHVAAFSASADLGISFSHSGYLNENGTPTGTVLIAGVGRPTLHAMVRRNHVGNGSAPVVRRACFDEAGLFREDLRSCEDYEMWCRILYQTQYSAELIPEVLTHYRLRETSLSFDFTTFLDNANRAVGHLQDAMPSIPRRALRAGHAEHYRIAAWKAVSSGQPRAGLGLLGKAVRLRPTLMLTDWRAIGTAVGAVLPPRIRADIAFQAKRLQLRQARTRGARLLSTRMVERVPSRAGIDATPSGERA